MRGLYWNRAFEGAAILAVFAGSASAAVPENICRGTRPLQNVSAHFVERVPAPVSGIPLDEALERQRDAVETIRVRARRYFLDHPHPLLDRLRERYTLLMPEAVQERLGFNTLVYMGEIATAVRYQGFLWRQYLEKFTRLEEAPSRDPNVLRFEATLDLAVFCRYHRKVEDLLSD